MRAHDVGDWLAEENARDQAEENAAWERDQRTLVAAELLDAVRAAVGRYVILPSYHALIAVTLWIAATHAQPAWNNATRLAISSPEKRCGKSRLLELLEALCHDSRMTASISTAALFRLIGTTATPPTILMDEADALFGTKVKADQNEDLRGLLNAGYSRSLPSIRCVGPTQIPKEFSNYAMAALAGIGGLPDTITDRAVNITMRRRARGETVEPYRQRRDSPPLHALRDQLADWLGPDLDELQAADPVMPLEDRAADNWAPLIAVADHAGGDWPQLARTAALVLLAEQLAADSDSLGVALLADIQTLCKTWPEPFMASKELAAQLRSDENAPWREMDLSPRRLATRLKGFGIRPGHNAAKTERGYRTSDFDDAIARYVP